MIQRNNDGLGWIIAEKPTEGPFLTQEEAVRRDEQLRLIDLLRARRDRLARYRSPYRDMDVTYQTLVVGVEIGLEILELGACPFCLGTRSQIPKKDGNLCRVCGTDYTDYSVPGSRT